MPILPRHIEKAALRWVALALALAALWATRPLWPPLLLAIWIAVMARPLLDKTSKLLHGRSGAAGVLTLLLVVVLFVPLAIIGISLTGDAVKLAETLMRSEGAQNALRSLVSSGGGAEAESASVLDSLRSVQGAVELLREHGLMALGVLGRVAGAAASGAVALFVFFYAIYVFLTDGPKLWEWLEDHSPLDRASTRRFAAAFNETGRGLFVGVGLAGLSQGFAATVTYLALGVPRALVLGLLTCIASIIPSVGTALVWLPVSAGLLLTGRPGAAGIMLGVGVVVVSSMDNLLRPVFARYGRLELSAFVLILSIFGGLVVFGGFGVLLGPLVFRLAKEALVLLRETRQPPLELGDG